MGRVAQASLAAVGLLTLLLSTTTDHHVCARTAAPGERSRPQCHVGEGVEEHVTVVEAEPGEEALDALAGVAHQDAAGDAFGVSQRTCRVRTARDR